MIAADLDGDGDQDALSASQFDNKMTWKNYGTYWHFDHIVPIHTANTIEDVVKLSHYTNLRPLEGKENMKKNGNILDYYQFKFI